MFVVTDTSIRPEGDRPVKVWPVSGFLGSRDPLWKPTQTQEQLCTAEQSRRRLWSSDDAERTPSYDPWMQKGTSSLIEGYLVYQELGTPISFSQYTYEAGLTSWKNNGGLSVQKYALSSFYLGKNAPSKIHGWGGGYSVRLMGYIRPKRSGDYTFYAANDDHVALRVDTVNGFIPSWSYDYRSFTQPDGSTPLTVNMRAGRWYEFDFLWEDGGGDRYYDIAWAGPGISTPVRIDPAFFGYKNAQLAQDFTY